MSKRAEKAFDKAVKALTSAGFAWEVEEDGVGSQIVVLYPPEGFRLHD